MPALSLDLLVLTCLNPVMKYDLNINDMVDDFRYSYSQRRSNFDNYFKEEADHAYNVRKKTIIYGRIALLSLKTSTVNKCFVLSSGNAGVAISEEEFAAKPLDCAVFQLKLKSSKVFQVAPSSFSTTLKFDRNYIESINGM